MSDTGYKPSAGELHAQRFAAKRLEEALGGRKTSGKVDWNRLARDAGLGAASGDSHRQVAAMTLAEIVEQLRMCGYTCAGGALENNVAFRALEQLAAATA